MDTKDIKPSTIMLIAGGVVLLLSTFLAWVSIDGGGVFDDVSFNGWETDLFGLLGIFCAIIGLGIGGGVAAEQFGNVTMPATLLGFTHNQVHLILSGMALVITLGFVIRPDTGIGLFLALIASGVMVAGSVMEMRTGEADAAPPTQF